MLATTPLIAAELGLRWAAPVGPADLADDPIFDLAGQQPLFVKSSSGDRWVIPESRHNFFRPATFLADKPADQVRIFVLGGSTVQGRPYETETAFAQWMQLRLSAAEPQRVFEVVNCGGVSYASYRLAILLREVLTHQPDAIVLYCGHNEFLEERSYATGQSALDRVSWLANRSQLVRQIRARVSGDRSQRQLLPSELTTRLDLIDGLKRYTRDDAWRNGVISHFGDTLRRMLEACEQADVPLIVCTPASDCVRTPPLKIEPIAMDPEVEATFETLWKTALDGNANPGDRLEACRRALRIDPEHAGVHFIAGRLHWQQHRGEAARRHLVAARDFDVCPLRAPTPIVQQILDRCEANGIQPVRVEQLLDVQDSHGRPFPDGLADPHRFVDHVHPTIAGHQKIGQAVAERVASCLGLPFSAQTEADYHRQAREHLASLGEDYFARGDARLEGLLRWAAGRAGKLSLSIDRAASTTSAAEDESPRDEMGD